jgi:hypothetical protein
MAIADGNSLSIGIYVTRKLNWFSPPWNWCESRKNAAGLVSG